MNRTAIRLSGCVRGGKNNMGVTKTGIHFPRKPFVIWRDEAIRQIRAQFAGQPFAEPVFARIVHRAGDRRRRDIPAVLDALFHALERAGVVADDSLIKTLNYSERYEKENPGADIVLEEINQLLYLFRTSPAAEHNFGAAAVIQGG